MKVRNVVITGASSGIGLELSRFYAKSAKNLVMISKTPEKLHQAANLLKEDYPFCQIHPFVADVSIDEEVSDLFEAIAKKMDDIGVLICNAGRIMCGRFEEQEPIASRGTFEINYWGMHYCAYYALPLLKKSKGSMAFVSSVAGFSGLFGYTHYAPSKFAIVGLAECLRMEMKDFGIRVSVVYPPDTQTPLLDYEHEHTMDECKALSAKVKIMSVEHVAKRIVSGIEKGRFEVYCNLESKIIRLLKGIAPGIYYKIVDGIVSSSRKTKKIKG